MTRGHDIIARNLEPLDDGGDVETVQGDMLKVTKEQKDNNMGKSHRTKL